MRKELNYYTIGKSYGWNQDWFQDFWMRMGGCAAVAACDICVLLKKSKGMDCLYPHGVKPVSKEEYEQFAQHMKSYLHPRLSGIDRLEIFEKGFGKYLRDCGQSSLKMRGLSGATTEQARQAVIAQIEAGYPIPFLQLKHKNPAFRDFVWHWFLLTGYEFVEGDLLVKAVTYGSWRWLDFNSLWNTGYRRKGGMILLSEAAENLR